MAKNFIQNGDTIDFIAAQAIKSGEVVVLGSLIAIAVTDIENQATGTGIVNGVWRVKAKQSDNITQGAVLYWDVAQKEATTTKGSNAVLGKAWNNSGTSSVEVDVKINA